jgi:hypothetical protein
MLDANTPAFRQQYPNGATVYDRTGRRIANVFACNPETGEAITLDTSGLTQALLRLVQLNSRKAWRLRLQGAKVSWQAGSYGVLSKSNFQLLRRHGFWPAPLRIERKQWLHIGFGQWGRDRPPLPVLDDRTPEEICGYGDDGLCSH